MALRESEPEIVYEIKVWENSPDEAKSFICNDDFWLAGIQEYRVHELISDGIYLFTQMAINKINSENNDKKISVRFSEYIKMEI